MRLCFDEIYSITARDPYGGWFVCGCGFVLWGGFLLYFLGEYRGAALFWSPFLVLLLGTGLSVGLAYAGYRLAGDDWTGWSEVRRVLAWGVGGLLLSVAFSGVTVVLQFLGGSAVGDVALAGLTSAGGGPLVGVLRGSLHVDARLDAERGREAQQAIDFLDRTLRHEVLNGLNVIQGMAVRAEERCDCAERDTSLDTIQARSQDLSEFVHSIRAFARTFAGEAQLTPVDIGGVLRRRVQSIRDAHPNAVVAVDVPEATSVRANETLGYVFGNLLENAVEQKEAVFGPELDRDHELGLYLARTLVTHYGGEIRLTDNEPRGTVATVELPRSG